ncbi:hypothetical protein DEO72_LG7g2018 [Vigna unguiculata]|uniref:Uncharacterized protein n=1 Tax=Vigna unguiculata TaxID=3917 RepID=A0A4D6MI78_VIGUN|nr:hypothetical protein DEO72_LG7g2018 [Vigna unguiculata]
MMEEAWKSERQVCRLLLAMDSHLHMRKKSHWMEWALILAVGESLEKKAMSRPLDLGLKNKKYLIVGPLNGLPLDVGLEGSCMLGGITSFRLGNSSLPRQLFITFSSWLRLELAFTVDRATNLDTRGEEYIKMAMI